MFISKKLQELLLLRERTGLRKIITNIVWLFADKILRMGCGLVVGVWVARYLGIERFGIFNYATAFIALFSPLATLGLDGLVIRRLVGDSSQQQQLLGTSFWMRFFAGWLTWGLTILSVFLLRHDDQTIIILVAILGSANVFQSLDTIDLWFQSQVQSKYTVFAKNIAFVIATFLKVLLINSKAPLLAFAWISSLEFALGAIGLIIVYEQQKHLLKLWSWSQQLAKELIKESLPLIFSGLTIMIYMRIDQIMLGQIIGDKAVGIYSAATRISEVWYFIPMAIASSVSPAIYEAKKVSETLYYRRIAQLNRLLVLSSFIIALIMTFLSGLIINLLFGSAYAESGVILAIHVWTSIFVFTGVATGSWFVAEHLTHLFLYRTLSGAVVNILLNIILIPKYGGIGAAIATIVAQSIASFFGNAVNPKTLKIFKVQIKSLLPISL